MFSVDKIVKNWDCLKQYCSPINMCMLAFTDWEIYREIKPFLNTKAIFEDICDRDCYEEYIFMLDWFAKDINFRQVMILCKKRSVNILYGVLKNHKYVSSVDSSHSSMYRCVKLENNKHLYECTTNKSLIYMKLNKLIDKKEKAIYNHKTTTKDRDYYNYYNQDLSHNGYFYLAHVATLLCSLFILYTFN